MPDTVSKPPPADASATGADLLRAYRFMLLARVMEDKLASLYRGGKIHGGVFLGRGQEALSAAVGLALREGDVFAPLIRDAAGRLAFGETVLDAVRTCMGSALGPMRGRDGNVHRGRPKAGYLPMISHLGATISVVNGALFAKRMKGLTGMVGAACVGEGATSTGSFHEALNQAAVEKLPLVLVVADNQFAYSTPRRSQFVCRSLVDRAAGYGVTGREIAEANDPQQCLSVVNAAVSDARSGGGPQLIVANLLRLCGHGEHDDASYITDELRKSPLGRDCLELAEEQMRAAGDTDDDTFKELRAEAVQQVEEAVARAQREPAPDPYQEDWCALASRHLQEVYEPLQDQLL